MWRLRRLCHGLATRCIRTHPFAAHLSYPIVIPRRAEAEADSILEQETLLGIPLTDNLTPLSDLRETLEPMARLWTTAKEYLDGHHAWLESPLRTVDAEAAERQVRV